MTCLERRPPAAHLGGRRAAGVARRRRDPRRGVAARTTCCGIATSSPTERCARSSARGSAIDPGAVAISRRCARCGDPAHGKPELAAFPELSFSLSHSESFAMIAVVVGRARVGVDIEIERPRSRLDALAARVLSAEEHAEWLDAEPPERVRAFLARWTAKEAYLKAIGAGITRPLREVPRRSAGMDRRLRIASPLGTVASVAVEGATAAVEIEHVGAARGLRPAPRRRSRLPADRQVPGDCGRRRARGRHARAARRARASRRTRRSRSCGTMPGGPPPDGADRAGARSRASRGVGRSRSALAARSAGPADRAACRSVSARSSRSRAIVQRASTSGRGVTPRPGPVGTASRPSSSTNGSVTSSAK